MPEHKETKYLPYPPAALFDLVADIEAYPEFLPWCQACRIRSQTGDMIEAEMVVGYKILRERFHCSVKLDRENRLIDVDYISGPLKYLKNRWHFRAVKKAETSGCEIEFYIDYAFQSGLLQTIMDGFFDFAFKRMVSSFEQRAKEKIPS